MGQGTGAGTEGLAKAQPSAAPAQEDGPRRPAQREMNVDLQLFGSAGSSEVSRKSGPSFPKLQGSQAWNNCLGPLSEENHSWWPKGDSLDQGGTGTITANQVNNTPPSKVLMRGAA